MIIYKGLIWFNLFIKGIKSFVFELLNWQIVFNFSITSALKNNYIGEPRSQEVVLFYDPVNLSPNWLFSILYSLFSIAYCLLPIAYWLLPSLISLAVSCILIISYDFVSNNTANDHIGGKLVTTKIFL